MARIRKFDIGYFVKEGVHSFFLNGFMTFASVGIITACFLIMGSFSLLAINIDNMVVNVQAENTITAFVDEALSDDEAKALEAQIKSVPYVDKTQFIPKDEALENYKEKLGEYASLFDGLEDDNPLRNGYSITMTDISMHEQVAENIGNIEGIARVESRGDISEKLVSFRGMINAVCLALIAMLGGVSIFIISNMVRLATFARREEIAIMKMVGATNSFVRMPFIIEGILLGVVAGIATYFIQWAFYSYLYSIVENIGIGFAYMLPFSHFAGALFGVLIAAGIFTGVVGSSLAIRKFLKV